MSKSARAAVAMSGGVDSSVAAALLLKEGYDVSGITLNFGGEAGKGSLDVRDAGRVARRLGIPHLVIDAEDDFKRLVKEPFLAAYAGGLTPVPCAVCNRRMKFGLLLERARDLGADFLATGHYAGLSEREPLCIRRPADLERDQTYFLYGLPAESLFRIRFPLAAMMKSEARTLARAWNLPVAGKPPSREVCFIRDGKTGEYIERELGRRPGLIVDARGNRLGEHKGVHFFTIGQRRGLELNGARGGASPRGPLHVIALDAAAGRVVVGPEEELFSSACIVGRLNLFCSAGLDGEATVKIRSRHPGATARIHVLDKERVRLEFLSPQRAVTPGQAAVFYRDGEMLGGGEILETARLAAAGAVR